jgi:hypothetical protein
MNRNIDTMQIIHEPDGTFLVLHIAKQTPSGWVAMPGWEVIDDGDDDHLPVVVRADNEERDAQ